MPDSFGQKMRLCEPHSAILLDKSRGFLLLPRCSRNPTNLSASRNLYQVAGLPDA